MARRDRDDNEFAGQYLPADIQKMQIIEIGKINRQSPAVGIFDEPTRCFKINQEWWAIVAGMVDWLADVAAWPDAQDEKYSAILEIQKFMQGVECMDCETVADCIDSSDATKLSLGNFLAESGFTPRPESSSADDIKPLPAEQTSTSLLAPDTDCTTPEQNMSIARSIVRELHEAFQDFLDKIELATNIIEAANITTDGVPILGALNNVTELADWYLETAAEIYQAAFNQTTEDMAACAIFCHLQDNCNLSLDELIEIYGTLGAQIPDDLSDLQAAVDFMIIAAFPSDIIVVASMHSMMLWLMRFAGSVFGENYNDIKNTIRGAATRRDYSYESECDDCPPSSIPPKTYWRIYADFALSKSGWIAADTATQYVQSAGFENIPSLGSNVHAVIDYDDLGLNSLGGNWQAVAMWLEIYAVDTENSGSNDFYQGGVYSGANQTGTFNNYGNATLGARSWGQEFRGNAGAATPRAVRSMRATRQAAGGAATKTAHWVRFTRAVLIGIADGNGNKPSQAHWWSNSLPANASDYFD